MNVHAVSLHVLIPNGNNYSIGVTTNDHWNHPYGIPGIIRGLTIMKNELWLMWVGLRCSFIEWEYKDQLEMVNSDGVKKWKD